MLDLKKKLVLNSIIILIIIFFISFTSASECYQESTNASNARDGSCTLNYTGSYGEVGTDIGFGSLWYDGIGDIPESLLDYTNCYLCYSIPITLSTTDDLGR